MRNAISLAFDFMQLAPALLGLGVGVALTLATPLAQDIRMTLDPGSTIGNVVALEPTNHQVIDYEYRVDDARMTGIGRTPDGVHFEDLRVGQTLPVFYATHMPQVSSLRDPAADLPADAVLVVLASAAVTAVAYLRLGQRRRVGFP